MHLTLRVTWQNLYAYVLCPWVLHSPVSHPPTSNPPAPGPLTQVWLLSSEHHSLHCWVIHVRLPASEMDTVASTYFSYLFSTTTFLGHLFKTRMHWRKFRWAVRKRQIGYSGSENNFGWKGQESPTLWNTARYHHLRLQVHTRISKNILRTSSQKYVVGGKKKKSIRNIILMQNYTNLSIFRLCWDVLQTK